MLRRACRLVKLRRSVHCYRSVKDPKLELRRRMHELAQVRIRYGYRRIHVLLRREGWQHRVVGGPVNGPSPRTRCA
jgi:putative transposase